jgi:hypothetical protein
MQFDQGRRELGGDPGQRFLGAPFQKMFSEKIFFGQQQLPPPPPSRRQLFREKMGNICGEIFHPKMTGAQQKISRGGPAFDTLLLLIYINL